MKKGKNFQKTPINFDNEMRNISRYSQKNVGS